MEATVTRLDQGKQEAQSDAAVEARLAGRGFADRKFADDELEAAVSPEILEIIIEGVPKPDRSDKFQTVINALFRLGFTIGDANALLSRYPDGIAEKFADRLEGEIERSFKSAARYLPNYEEWFEPPIAEDVKTEDEAETPHADAKGTKGAKQTPHPIFDPWEKYIVPSFPFDILPPDVSRFIEAHSLSIGCNPSGLAMCVLAAFSGALDHRFRLKLMRHGNFYASPRLWVLLFGDPSVKKTPMQNAALAPLQAHENRIRNDYAAAAACHVADAKERKDAPPPPPPPRHIAADTTIEKLGELLARHDRGLLVRRDEIAGWIGSMEKYAGGSKAGATDPAFWLQAYDGGSYTVDRISRGEILIRNLSVSVLGGIQPTRLAELRGLTSDGLLQRFIPVILTASRFPDGINDDGSGGAYARQVPNTPRCTYRATPLSPCATCIGISTALNSPPPVLPTGFRALLESWPV